MKVLMPDFNNREDEAMAQALFSRSDKSMEDHINKIKEVGSGNFMKKFYVGYGHDSIGDCGTTTISIEDVSILAAKAIENHQLFAGQETSTRYLDFSKREFINPLKIIKQRNTGSTNHDIENIDLAIAIGDEIHRRLRKLYVIMQTDIKVRLMREYPDPDKRPIDNGSPPSTYENAINAKTFDIVRSLLPAGASTQVAWHTRFSNLNNELMRLAAHPLEEVNNIADEVSRVFRDKYPSSVKDIHRSSEIFDYYKRLGFERHYGTSWHKSAPVVELNVTKNDLSVDIDEEMKALLKDRPKYAKVDPVLTKDFIVKSKFKIDFGGYRDIDRHRTGINSVSLLTPDLGFNEWYIDRFKEFSSDRGKRVYETLKFVEESLRYMVSLGCNPVHLQYFIPMGYDVSMEMVQPMHGFIYMVELRSGETVHPTVRRVAISLASRFTKNTEIDLHYNPDPNPEFTIKRGKQTIEEKK